MKKNRIIMVICLIICAVCLYLYFEPYLKLNNAKKSTEIIVDNNISKDGDYLDVDFESLQAENPDCVGWLYIPDSEQFSYPVVASKDNHEYLITGFDGEQDDVGVPFVDMNCASDFSSFNTLIYGHYTVTHYMFGELYDIYHNGLDAGMTTLQLYTPDNKVRIYNIFSIREVEIANTQMFLVGTFSDEDKASFVNEAVAGSVVNFNVDVSSNNDVINLVCCTESVDENKRLIVSCMLADTVELN